MNHAGRMADAYYRFIVSMRIAQIAGGGLLLLGLLSHTPQLLIIGAVGLIVPQPLKRGACVMLARWADVAEYSGSVRKFSGLDHSNHRRSEDYTRIWLRHR